GEPEGGPGADAVAGRRHAIDHERRRAELRDRMLLVDRDVVFAPGVDLAAAVPDSQVVPPNRSEVMTVGEAPRRPGPESEPVAPGRPESSLEQDQTSRARIGNRDDRRDA